MCNLVHCIARNGSLNSRFYWWFSIEMEKRRYRVQGSWRFLETPFKYPAPFPKPLSPPHPQLSTLSSPSPSTLASFPFPLLFLAFPTWQDQS